MKTLATVAVAVLAAVTATVTPALANVGDPTITVTAGPAIAGTPVTFTVTVTPGTDGRVYYPTPKIIYTNPRTHSTVNVANLSAFTTVYGTPDSTFTYTPSLSETGRTETFIATIYLPASGHLVRPVSGYTGFTVTTP